tara:strand:+ start:1735 stop:2199 length:465 start_codon:yes stop_codon:yes gene_type:complete
MSVKLLIQTDFHNNTNEQYTYLNSKIFNFELEMMTKLYSEKELIFKLDELKEIRLATKVVRDIKQCDIDTSKITLKNNQEVEIKEEWIKTWLDKSNSNIFRQRILSLNNQEEFDNEMLKVYQESNYTSIVNQINHNDKDCIFNRLLGIYKESKQ